ncbi:MAG: alpha/beta hydrolase [Betaproteobacteria bacterium]|nr:MAG: alpha/beta hydrolase [Betaproteobacteria bacterium]
MAVDPQMQVVIERVANSALPPYHRVSAGEARRLYKVSRAALSPPVPGVEAVRDLAARGPAGPIPLRLYRGLGTAAGAPLPLLVYFHGGGWTIGDLDTHDIVCRTLANRARCAVIAVDYRMSPEHKFPAAVEDCIAATRWVAEQGSALGIDAKRIAVGGDSAGGNLAAVVAIALRDAGGPALAFQALAYPATDQRLDSASHAKFGEGYLLSRDNLLWFRDNYLSPGDYDDWRASPIRAADLARLPPAHIITAGYDPLLDEGRAYSERLVAAGVPVLYECFEGMAHGFLTMGGVVAAANHALYRLGHSLAQAFTPARA